MGDGLRVPSAGNSALIAFISFFVSASSLRYFSGTAGPTVTVTCGGCARLKTFGGGRYAGQTRSVPHKPTGMTGTLVMAARRAAPQRPLSTGSKKASPRGMVP